MVAAGEEDAGYETNGLNAQVGGATRASCETLAEAAGAGEGVAPAVGVVDSVWATEDGTVRPPPSKRQLRQLFLPRLLLHLTGV